MKVARYRPRHRGTAAPGFRRGLQLGLAALWLLDGALQLQPSMYSRSFSQALAASAAGNPGLIARPITWSASLVGHYDVVLNTVFAAIQVLLGAGIAFRPTVRAALAASIAWSAGVWWLGEGLGGILAGTASPVTGAPGAVILYALLAILLWPAAAVPASPAPFAAARAVGAPAARALWLALWLAMACLALAPGNRAPEGLSGAVAAAASGEPGWLAHGERAAAAALSSHGLGASLVLAEVFALIAIGGCLRRAFAVPVLGLAIVVALAIWVLGEAFGGILTGAGTDPNTGPPLVLLALAYWPATVRPGARAAVVIAAEPGAGGSPAPRTARSGL